MSCLSSLFSMEGSPGQQELGGLRVPGTRETDGQMGSVWGQGRSMGGRRRCGRISRRPCWCPLRLPVRLPSETGVLVVGACSDESPWEENPVDSKIKKSPPEQCP